MLDIVWDITMDHLEDRVKGRLVVGRHLVDKFLLSEGSILSVKRVPGHHHTYKAEFESGKWAIAKYEFGETTIVNAP